MAPVQWRSQAGVKWAIEVPPCQVDSSPKMKTGHFCPLYFRRAPLRPWMAPLDANSSLRPKIGHCSPGMDHSKLIDVCFVILTVKCFSTWYLESKRPPGLGRWLKFHPFHPCVALLNGAVFATTIVLRRAPARNFPEQLLQIWGSSFADHLIENIVFRYVRFLARNVIYGIWNTLAVVL